MGEIMSGLTKPAVAAEVIATLAKPEVLARARDAATAKGLPVGALVASKVRHLAEHGGEDIWLDLFGAMSGLAQPGAAAIERMLAYAFPDPVRVRVAERNMTITFTIIPLCNEPSPVPNSAPGMAHFEEMRATPGATATSP